MKIGFGITGSFCTIPSIYKIIEKIVEDGHEVLPILSTTVATMDTRATKSKEVIETLKRITGKPPVVNLNQAEVVGPSNIIDVIVIAPATGTTISKLANAISDSPITMTAKSLMRNNKPVVIGVSTNDGLGLNMTNIATLMNSKNVYFVPFGQDNFEKKPKSLVADFSKILETVEHALEGKQIQPLLI
ncbi:MAG: dipicolinate synthase subunit B [Firmicutes bacterium]|nr:dipicolinate synthase subunit B [Bacillota bacterium]